MDSLGDRMKAYEDVSRIYLMRRSPIIIRIDGKAFHTFTRGFERPFDNLFMEAMQYTAKELSMNIMGCKLAYTQSDEISLLLTDYDTLTTQAWFANNLQKMVSVAASMATLEFNREFRRLIVGSDMEIIMEEKEIGDRYKLNCAYNIALMTGAMFDARAFVLPKEEVCNYFIWRQKDAIRNSILSVGQSNFSHKELEGKSCNDVLEMLRQKGIEWSNYPIMCQRGSCMIKEVQKIEYCGEEKTVEYHIPRWKLDKAIPIFTECRDYIETLI